MNAYTMALGLSARVDICEFFTECVASSAELMNKARSILLSKGLFIRPAYIPYPEKIEYIHHEKFIMGLFKEDRSLLSIELSHLHLNMHTNELGSSLLRGFSQVASSKDVREYMFRGKEIAKKHIGNKHLCKKWCRSDDSQ